MMSALVLSCVLSVVLTTSGGPASSSTPPATTFLLYVDPTYERVHVLPACESRGDATCVLLHSTAAAAAILEEPGDNEEDEAERALRVESNTVPPPGAEQQWLSERLPENAVLAGVLCGSDGGLADAERLQDALIPSRSNGVNAARRDKFLMAEAVRAAGLAAPAQCNPRSWSESRRFLNEDYSRWPVILKPRRGQASVLVGLAHDEAEAKAMDTILREPDCHASIDTSETAAGDANVVIQEYLEGDEWVVDCVSRDGEHKAVALWKYDKGPKNGAPFVYFCDELRACEGAKEEALVQYAFDALDALGWRWGPCHIELKFETEAAERGEYVHTTVDLATCAGFATLLHADKEVVDAEYAQLRAMQERGLHEVAPE